MCFEQCYANFISLGDGNNVVDAGVGSAEVRLGNGRNTVDLHGWNNQLSVGSGVNTIHGGSGNDVIELAGGSANLTLCGDAETVFLGGSSSDITDTSQRLTLHVSAGGLDVIRGFGITRGSVVDLLGGAGGYQTAADILKGLTYDGHGGTELVLGVASSIDFLGLSQSTFTAHNFKIS